MASTWAHEKKNMIEELERNINPCVVSDSDVPMDKEGTMMERGDRVGQAPPTEDEDDEELDEDMDVDTEDYEMWHDDNLAAGEILDDLAMSDSDEDERAD
ncbi:hypothetical protein CAEBREN_21296 [Caenorhabditis brenneri]|uniref:Uncharacterized protein n=1 Tax=Caenorhabditis brenneri TaxID=135651 RepID=G0P790_CAEBE|nr:hypothetical protein CAEBREN_21296 [Caenorhabditis brenneri]